MYDELQTLLLSFIFKHLHIVWEKPCNKETCLTLLISGSWTYPWNMQLQNIYRQLNEASLGLACEWAFEGMRCGEFCFRHEKEIHK